MERTLAAALGMLALAIVIRSVPWMPALWIGTVSLGMSIATMNVLLPALLKRDFPTEAGRLTGIFSAVSAAVAATASGLAVPIAGLTDHGWRIAFGIWAAMALIGFGVFLPQLRRHTLPKHDHAAALDPHPGGHRSPWRSALGWQITIFMGVQSLFFYTVLTWWPTIEESHGTTAATAGLHQGIMQIFSIVGSLLTAVLLHKLPKDQRGAVLGLVSVAAVAVLGQLLLPSWALLWNAFLGIGIGGSIVIALSFFAIRTVNHGQAAALSGMAQSVGYLLAATGPLVFGALHDAVDSWTTPLIALLVLLAVQLVFGSLAGRNKTLG